ncbi:hypothetical protein BOM25_15955 [Serratia sp. OPWLW2]|nr:hypothetical protein BOM25_15955 [Serratia sp. OPWLW2]
MSHNTELTIDQKLQVARMATDVMTAAIAKANELQYQHIFRIDRDDTKTYLPSDVLTATYNQLIALITTQQSDSR